MDDDDVVEKVRAYVCRPCFCSACLPPFMLHLGFMLMQLILVYGVTWILISNGISMATLQTTNSPKAHYLISHRIQGNAGNACPTHHTRQVKI